MVPPNIKRFSITVKSGEGARALFLLPRNGVPPPLESLHVKSFSPHLGGIVLPNLRTLAVHNLYRHSPSLPQLMAAIRGSPILESLEVVNCSISRHADLHAPTTVIPTILPQLKRITLAEIPGFAISHLLSHLETPGITSLSVHTHCYAGVGSEQDHLIQVDEITDTIQSLHGLIPLFGEDASADSEEAPFAPTITMDREQLRLEFGRGAAFRVVIMGARLEKYFPGWSNLVQRVASCIRPVASLQLHFSAGAISAEKLTTHLIAMDTYFPSITTLTFIYQSGRGPPLQLSVPIQGQSRWLFPAVTHLRISIDASKEVIENIINIAKARQEAAGPEPPSRLQKLELRGKWLDPDLADIESRTGIATSKVSFWLGPDHQPHIGSPHLL